MEQREHKILLPQPNTPKAAQKGGLWRIWKVDTEPNLPRPHQEGLSPTKKGKKHTNPALKTRNDNSLVPY